MANAPVALHPHTCVSACSKEGDNAVIVTASLYVPKSSRIMQNICYQMHISDLPVPLRGPCTHNPHFLISNKAQKRKFKFLIEKLIF